MLSVSGARGLVGRTMTPVVAARFAAAFASHLCESAPRPRVVVGRDGRASGEALGRAVEGALMGCGCDVIDVGIVATPTVAVAIREHAAQGGLAVTASHNPIDWNGLKALDADGLAPPPPVAQSIIARFQEGRLDWAGPLGAGTHHRDHEADERHVHRVLAQVDAAVIRAAQFRVVLDSVNGGGAASGRMLLERLGCEVIHLNGEHTGDFAHTPEPIEANLTQLMRAVAADGAAAVGFAQDPDADRLAIVDERGRFIGEECTLALVTRRMLDRASTCVVCTNLSTSRMVDDLCAQHPGSRVVRTAVGEANVVAGMRAEGALLGGEGNGGVILPGVCWVRDSLSAMALTLELMAATGKHLSVLAGELPRYSMVKRKLDLSAVGGRDAMARAFAGVRQAFSAERLTDSDGLRVDWPDGWVHLRASNTEPIVRIIGEAATAERAGELCDRCARAAGF
ncbi:MAG: phosphoglucosamine mutase [Planctomycetota bacterium]|nr:phosphoglucosamine mutase [Planctomycetota bacterium]